MSKGRIARSVFYLIVLRREKLACTYAKASKKELEDLVMWVNRSDYAPWPKSDIKGFQKRFYSWYELKTDEGPFPKMQRKTSTSRRSSTLRVPLATISEEKPRGDVYDPLRGPSEN